MKSLSHRQVSAFTRLELLVCIAIAMLLSHVFICALARSTSRSDRVACLSNLRQIGVGYSHCGLEHNDLPPWRVSTREGGTSDYAGGIPGLVSRNSLYVQYSILSNDLDSSRYLADPGDMRSWLRQSLFFNTQNNGGLYHPSFQDNAVSYFLGLQGTFRTPRSILCGDRNVLSVPSVSGGCSGISPTRLLRRDTFWTNDVHGFSGNLLLFDGSVEQATTPGLRAAIDRSAQVPGGATCVLFPGGL